MPQLWTSGSWSKLQNNYYWILIWNPEMNNVLMKPWNCSFSFKRELFTPSYHFYTGWLKNGDWPGIVSTGPGTGVLTPLLDARLVAGALRVDNALGSAVWRLTDHAGLASAVTTVTIVAGRVGERTAGVGVARILFDNRCNGCGIRISQHVTPICIIHV